MTPPDTQMLGATPPELAIAARILASGGLVAFPTETVYGLGADACNDRAVAAIYAAKGRPTFNPLIVHVPDLESAARYCHLDDGAARLADAFWPGALTLVLPLRSGAGISRLVTAGLDTLAIRVPDSATAQGLLRAFGGPVAAPSANPSGRISPTRADHVMAGLGGRIDAIVDGGSCSVGLESTIVGFGDGPTLLRAGGIPVEALETCLGQTLRTSLDATDNPVAPGQLMSHYAPNGQVRLDVVEPRPDEVLLGFGHVEGATLNLSRSGDLMEAAANLFGMLHELDRAGASHIAVSPVPDHGLGRAINDRLRRAAAPRGPN